MPKNETLIKDIQAINPDAEVEGLTNAQLVKLLAELREGADAPAEEKAYYVAEGKAITTRRGQKRAGAPLVSSDFSDGEQALKRLVSIGAAVLK